MKIGRPWGSKKAFQSLRRGSFPEPSLIQKMKKLIIISQEQFGYHIDTYYYCKYLRDEFDIDYICWDQGLPKMDMTRVRVYYVSRESCIPVRTIRFLRTALMLTRDKKDNRFS